MFHPWLRWHSKNVDVVPMSRILDKSPNLTGIARPYISCAWVSELIASFAPVYYGIAVYQPSLIINIKVVINTCISIYTNVGLDRDTKLSISHTLDKSTFVIFRWYKNHKHCLRLTRRNVKKFLTCIHVHSWLSYILLFNANKVGKGIRNRVGVYPSITGALCLWSRSVWAFWSPNLYDITALPIQSVLASRYCRCLSLPVRVCQPRICLRHNSSPVQPRITKFGSYMQNTFDKIPKCMSYLY